jgi:hypothetical protein
VVKTYLIVLQVTNLARTDIRLFAKGLAPLEGVLIKNNVIVLIKMPTQQSSPVTFTVMDDKTKEAYYINGAASFAVLPKLVADTPEPLTVTRSGISAHLHNSRLDLNVLSRCFVFHYFSWRCESDFLLCGYPSYQQETKENCPYTGRQ